MAETLASRSRDLQHKLRMLRDSANEEALIGSLTTRRIELGAIHQRLTRLRGQIQILRNAGAQIPFTEEFFQFLHGQKQGYREIGAAFEADSRSLIEGEGRERFKEQKDFADKLGDQIEAILKEAWQKYVQQRRFALNDQRLETLACIPTFRTKIAGVREANRQLSEYCTKVPMNSAAIEKFLALNAALRVAWDDLKAEDIPEAAQTFLKMLGTGAAPLAMVTEEVRAWMIAEDIVNLFVVGIRERREA